MRFLENYITEKILPLQDTSDFINPKGRIPRAYPWMNGAPGIGNSLAVKVRYGVGRVAECTDLENRRYESIRPPNLLNWLMSCNLNFKFIKTGKFNFLNKKLQITNLC